MIVLPAQTPSPNLCKVVASAVALGYPAPVIVNWQSEQDTELERDARSHLSKITGVLEFLEWATRNTTTGSSRLEEGDLVLMLDAYDVWLQLPPDVLLRRYFAANHKANELLARKQSSLARIGLSRQTILASSQKRCYAPKSTMTDLHCKDLPEGTMPDDVFGFFTDSKFFNHQYSRPRFLNSGSFMGPAGDMRKYFQRVSDKMDVYLAQSPTLKQLSGDQGMFAEVFGEQEQWRNTLSVNDPDESARVQHSARDFEYHVGLDYSQELFYPTCYSEKSGSFVRLQDSEAVRRESKQAGVTDPRIHKLPSDISSSPVPLAALAGSSIQQQTWMSVSLYVDYWTASIPVAVHHNAWRNGMKGRLQTWWDRTWYFPYLRELLDLRMASNSTNVEPIARISASVANHTLTAWPYHGEGESSAALLFEKDEYGNRSLKRADWDTICQSRDITEAEHRWHDEVFRDGKGGLK